MLIAVGLVAVVLASLATLYSWADPFDDHIFSSQQWASASPDDRAPMARDVVSRVRGLDREEVIAMLGHPGDLLDSTTDAGGHQLRGVEVFSYYLGSWSMQGMDDAFVYVHFDSQGTVIHSEITGY